METVEIAKTEYDELRARPQRSELDDLAARAEKAEKDVETAEANQKKAEGERDELKDKVEVAEEKARQATLRDERIESLGAGFTAALGEKTKERLRNQAGTLADADWTARLEELEELTGKKRDLGGEEKPAGDGTFSADEVARFQAGGDGADSKQPTPNQRRSVFAGLSKS